MDIGRMLTWTADRYPGRTAVGGPRPLTYQQWDARTNRLARALAGLGVRPGDRVAFLLAGGEPMASLHLAALAGELDDALHPEAFVNHFGSTEIYMFTISPDAQKKPGCAGRAGVFSRVRLVDPADPATVGPRGTQGQVAVSMASPEAFAGYRNRPDADARAIRDGWYLTGDLATEDDDGDLWVSGRVDDMINSGGENLYPDEIEAVLARCPAVSAVVVVGLPDDRWGQAVTAFVVPAKDFSAERTVAHLAAYAKDGSGLPSLKRPKRYIAVDRIPTSAVGKILRRELTEGRYHPLAEVRALTGPMTSLAADLVDTPGDMHASNAYRRRLFTHLAARELANAHARATRADPVREPTGVRPSPDGSRISSAPTRKCLAGDRVTTTMSVNGKQATIEAPPRMTLADALRDRLGLKGTHVGCEHGICGMCTVLVDGQAARSCLLFACQLDGAEVLTVEGLGRPGELHPLQQAFGRHHALQCGFCTPGFLLSAYDLLRHRPEVAEDELPAELSGVLCRCTGYRNILSAVAEVARTHPDGLPAPLNCAPHPG
jgi:aerobic-type carbon monoxide dehydrogenase small subunit (CoxS/CutS family)